MKLFRKNKSLVCLLVLFFLFGCGTFDIFANIEINSSLRKRSVKKDGGSAEIAQNMQEGAQPKAVLPGLLEEVKKRNSRITESELAAAWDKFEKANRAIYSALGGGDFDDFMKRIAGAIEDESNSIDKGRQRVILFSENNRFIPGFYPVLAALRELESVKVSGTDKPILRIGIYGDNSGIVSFLGGNSKIATAEDLPSIMEIMLKEGIEKEDIVVVVADNKETAAADFKVKQIIAGDIFTLAAAEAVKTLFGTSAVMIQKQAVDYVFGRFFRALVTAGVVSESVFSEKYNDIVTVVINAQEPFNLPEIVEMEQAKRIEIEADRSKLADAMAEMGV